MNDKNEYKEWPGKSQRTASAWKRPPDFPNWSVTVKYGDDGYECDPGTWGENKEQALKEVTEAIEELKEIKKWIEEEL